MASPLSFAAFLWLGAGFLYGVMAGTEVPGPPRAGNGSDEWMRAIPLLYKNPANPYLQELAVQGHLQIQYAAGASNAGNFGTADLPDETNWGDTEVRRARVGLRALMVKHLKFQSLLDIYPDLSPEIYKGIAEVYLAYSPCDAFTLGVGKTEVKFTREMEISAREIVVFERSQLVNMFYCGELSGVWISGKGIAGGGLYELGAYNNDITPEFPDVGGGAVILAKTGYNYSRQAGLDFAQAEIHYQYNSNPGYVGSTGKSPLYSNGVAISNDLTEGRFSMTTECFWGEGDGNRPNVGGLTIMPTWFVTSKLQWVSTFQFAASNGDEGIPLPKRYEQQVAGGKNLNGDAYFAAFSGLNYYFDGSRLKVMSGVKFSSMRGGNEDFSGWTWLAGIRTYF